MKAWHWARTHLFSNPVHSIITLALLYVLYHLVATFFMWAIWKATWQGNTREVCEQGGACWPFIRVRLDQIIYGFYPAAERFRVTWVGGLLVISVAQLAIRVIPLWCRLLIVGAIFPTVAVILLYGGVFGLEVVETEKWGGLFLTLVLAISGIVLSFPFALLLALGRASRLLVIKSLCVVFIEVVRGVPLISVLFMASVMLPLFLPEGVNFDKLLRALIGITLFQAAYLAEVIRGGLQGISKGQYEAAKALGMGYWRMMGFIVLPQALTIMIPGIVNTFIALFKDTTLVLIIGLFDFLGMVQAATTAPNWLGTATEGYVFCALIYWVICFGMSTYSRWLEKRLRKGKHAI